MSSYYFADPAWYFGIERQGLKQASLNPYIKTEADIQVKFGGYLDRRLDELDTSYTVHAELSAYRDNPRNFADLSVHAVGTGTLRTESQPDPAFETLRAVIEIEYANYRDCDNQFENGAIRKDMDKLTTLPRGVLRTLLILDESLSINPENVRAVIDYARANDIIILSNNNMLYRRDFPASQEST